MLRKMFGAFQNSVFNELVERVERIEAALKKTSRDAAQELQDGAESIAAQADEFAADLTKRAGKAKDAFNKGGDE